MSLPSEVTSLLAGGAKKYEISRSLRFNSADSAYLSGTFGSGGSQTTWTWSGWLKLSSLDAYNSLFSSFGGGSNYGGIRIDNSNRIEFYEWNGSSFNFQLLTTALYRDVSAWYHIVVLADTANATSTERIKLYVNGTQVTSFSSSTYPSLSYSTFTNSNNTHLLGSLTTNGSTILHYLNGYMTEINFVDGQALTPSSFGETDPVTGVWIPKRYTGTYGTNGFYLSFANNASTTTLGYDDGTGIAGSGAGSNDWTLNNFSVTAGVGNDSLEDTPTNNFATLNPLNYASNGITLSDANLNCAVAAISANYPCGSTIAVTSGKWYFEVTIATVGGNFPFVGIIPATNYLLGSTTSVAGFANSVWAGNNGFANGDVCGIAFDLDTLTFNAYKNGVLMTVASSHVSSNSIASGLTWMPAISGVNGCVMNVNFGQRPFAYTPPAGFKALNTKNLTTPTILKPSQYMNIVTWTGTGATRSITGVGFQPDLVWSKSRSNAETHKLVDSTRGATKALSSETTGDEVTESGITSFDSDGFTIDGATDTGYNTNTYTYVGWNWKKGVTPGFDIVTYTGNGSARTISHSLGVAPKMMIVKARTTASTDQGWAVYHASNTTAPETDYLLLNSTAATADLNTVWNDTAPTSSVFSVGTNALVNTNNDTYVAYLWTEITGFSRFGSYTGNGSTDGPFVWCGFRPRLILIKESSSTGSWGMLDSARSPVNPINNQNLWADLANATGGASAYLDILSNGFKIRDTDSDKNTSSQTYIFAAFAENPFKYSLAR